MYFLYADESGDTGIVKSPTRYFCLSGLVVHELKWHDTLQSIVDFRRHLRANYGLKLREELHATALIHKPGDLARIPKSRRLQMMRDAINFQASLPDVNIINVVVDKQNKQPTDDIFDIAWTTLVQRFHNTISHRNFPGPQNPVDHGMLIVDETEEPRLRALTRRMRKYNPVPSMYGGSSLAIPTTTIVEDAAHRNSLHSYFIQLCDLNAFFLYQMQAPCAYIKKKGCKNYLNHLLPVLCTKASNTSALGIVSR